MNATWILCETAADLAHSTELKIILIFRATVSIVGIVLFALLFKAQGTYLALHANARVLMMNHHFWAIASSLSNLISIVTVFTHFWPDYDNPCDYLFITGSVLLARGGTILCRYAQVFMFVIMTAERLMATVRYRTYESSKATLGILLIMIQLALSLFCCWLLFYKLNLSDLKAYPTVTTSKTTSISNQIYAVIIFMEVVCFIIFYGLLKLNERFKLKAAQASLTEKYQIDENMRAIRLMMPMVITHFCIFVPTCTVTPIYTTFFNPNILPTGFTLFSEIFNIIYTYSVVLPIVLFWRHKTLRENLRIAMNFNMTFPETERADGRTQQQMRHFQILQDMWTPPNRIL